MAGIQWKGGKCHGAGEAKAILRHNDKSQRLIHGHNNPDINLELTPLNVSYYGHSYYQKVKLYDALIASTKCRRMSTGKNATVTMQDLCIYCPKGMMDEATGKYDYEKVKAWFHDVGDILKSQFGDDFIDLDVHFDEVHLYVDPGTDDFIWSRVHGHAALIPTIQEKQIDENGQMQITRTLNAKKFSAKSRIVDLNKKIHQMTMEKYHMPYMDGSRKKGTGKIEDKKRESIEALARKEKQIEDREKALAIREQEIQELIILGRRAKAAQLSEPIPKYNNAASKHRRLPDIDFLSC